MSAIAQGSISSVPQDVIDSIIDEVANLRRNESEKQDLWSCSLVSPAFRNRSQSWLLRTLKIEIYPTQFRETINAWIHHTLETNPRIASYVRSMSISIQVDDLAEDLQPAGVAGFSGSPLTLPNLHELEIAAPAYHNILFCYLSVELETELTNLLQSPQLRSVLFCGIVPPVNLAALYKLNYLEMRDNYYDRNPAIHPSLRGLRGLGLSRNDESLQSLLCLCDDWEPEKILFSGALAPHELCMKPLKGYAVYLTKPEKLGLVQMALSNISKSLHSFSITVGEPLLSSFPITDDDSVLSRQVLDLRILSNLAELEFIVDNEPFSTASGIWPFIQNTLMTLPPFNELITFKLVFSGLGFKSDVMNELAQLDNLLSNVARFNMLRRVVVSPLGDPIRNSILAKISSRGIVVNDVDGDF